MVEQVTIYALADPRSIWVPRYVGATGRPLVERLWEHCSQSNRLKGNKDPWVLALRDIGLNPVIWPIEICEAEQWELREKFWIRLLRPLGTLLNIASGGEGCPDVQPSALSNAKLVQRNKLPWTDARRKNLGRAKTGAKYSRKAIDQRLASPGWRAVNEAQKRKVLWKETGRVFESLSDCARFFRKTPSCILRRIRLNCTSKGLTFTYYVSASAT